MAKSDTPRDRQDNRRENHPQFLYAVEFSDGRVKVGRSAKPLGRFVQLEYAYRGRVVRSAVFPYAVKEGCIAKAERELIDRLGRIAAHRPTAESFEGLQFGIAVTLAGQMARRSYGLQANPRRWVDAATYWARVYRVHVPADRRRTSTTLETIRYVRRNIDADPRFRQIIRQKIERKRDGSDNHREPRRG